MHTLFQIGGDMVPTALSGVAPVRWAQPSLVSSEVVFRFLTSTTPSSDHLEDGRGRLAGLPVLWDGSSSVSCAKIDLGHPGLSG